MKYTIELPYCYGPEYSNARYGTLDELKEKLLFKRIVEWDEKHLTLEDGTEVTIELSESDCCAYAGGEFKDVKLDAVITDVEIGEQVSDDSDWGIRKTNKVTIYHNQNTIALAECEAEHNGYYYSVGSLVIGDVHFPVVEA
ncbi:hypothetical protein VMHJH2_09565 [Streptococcus uberis]|uniref:DUF7448 domain-containing protein n=1 Tax=Streptococcus uberis TaxID=1349 RepID=UPI00214FA5A4|nr:hypothetical protein [Streptococcus uberis]MCR4258766.1 hypothetical protein [Streptococcus uberis]